MAGQSEVAGFRYWAGVVFVALGTYLFLRAAGLARLVAWDEALFVYSGFALTSGMLLAALFMSLVIAQLDPQSLWPWIAAVVSVVPLGIRIYLEMRSVLFKLSALELVGTVVLMVLGVGLLLSSIRTSPGSRTRGL